MKAMPLFKKLSLLCFVCGSPLAAAPEPPPPPAPPASDAAEIRAHAEAIRKEATALAAAARAQAAVVRTEARAQAEAAREARAWAFEWRAREGEEAPRPFLGVVTEPLPVVLRDYVQIPDGEGLLISRVVPEEAAARAGLQDNDILLSFGGTSVDSPAALSRLLAEHEAGDTVDLRILRRGAEQTVTVTLGARKGRSGQWVPEHLGKSISAAINAALSGEGGEAGLQVIESVREWIPGSVRVVVDDDERIVVDLSELRESLADMRAKLEAMRAEGGGGEASRKSEAGTRSTTLHLGSANFTLETEEGRATIIGSGDERQVRVSAPDGSLLHEGPLPTDDTAHLPERVRPLVDRLLETVAGIDVPEDTDIDVRLTLPEGS